MKSFKFLLILSACILLTTSACAQQTIIQFASNQWEERGFKEFYTDASRAFEKEYPQYRIEEVFIPKSGFTDKIVANILAGVPPDIWLSNGEELPYFHQMDALLPLDEWLDTTDIKENFAEQQTLHPIVIDGQTYAIIVMLATRQMFYNQKLLEENNIDVPHNYEELILAAEKINNPPNIYGFALTTKPEYPRMYTEIFIFGCGFGARPSADGKITINTPEWKRAFEAYKEIFDKGLSPVGFDSVNFARMFVEGSVAFFINGPWFYAVIENDAPEMLNNENLGVTTVPFPAGEYIISDNLICVSKDVKPEVKEGVFKYLEYITGPYWSSKFPEYTQSNPGRKLGSYSDEIIAKYPGIDAFLRGAPYGAYRMVEDFPEKTSEIGKLLIDTLNEVLFRDLPVEKALEEAQIAAEKIVE